MFAIINVDFCTYDKLHFTKNLSDSCETFPLECNGWRG